MPALASLAEFRQAVADFPAGELEITAEPAARAAAERSLAESGFLLLGEVHGVRENPLIIAALLRSLGLTSLALEWPAELAPVISAFLAGEALADDPQLWSGDGRITAGHLAALRGLAAAGPLELTLLDGALPVERGMADASWSDRDAAMARRLLAGTGAGPGTLVVAGNAHTRPPHAARCPARCRPGRAPAGRPRDPDRLSRRVLLQPRAAPVPAAPGLGPAGAAAASPQRKPHPRTPLRP